MDRTEAVVPVAQQSQLQCVRTRSHSSQFQPVGRIGNIAGLAIYADFYCCADIVGNSHPDGTAMGLQGNVIGDVAAIAIRTR